MARRRRRFRVGASRVRDGGIFRDAHRSFRAGRSRGRAHVEREGRGAAAIWTERFAAATSDGAAALCPRVLRGDASAWERWVFHFAHVRARSQSRAVSPHGESHAEPDGVRGCAARLLGRRGGSREIFSVRAIVAAAAVRRSGARRRDATTHRRRRRRQRAPSRRERGRPTERGRLRLV